MMNLFEDPTALSADPSDLDLHESLTNFAAHLYDRYVRPEADRQMPPQAAPPVTTYITAHRCSRGLYPNCTEPVYSANNCPWCGAPRVPIDGVGYVAHGRRRIATPRIWWMP